jgi:hypothetical protein
MVQINRDRRQDTQIAGLRKEGTRAQGEIWANAAG